MRVKAYYLIRLKSGALSGTDIDESSWEALSNPQLWESPEGGKNLWSPDDFMMRSKLAFLINLKQEFKGSEGVDRIFRDRKISLNLFDQYWDIERLQLTGSAEEVPDGSLDRSEIELSGYSRVDEWLVQKMSAR